MKVLLKVGDVIETLYLNDNTTFHINTPMPGFIRAVQDGKQDIWLNSIHVLAMVPNEESNE